MFKKFLGILFFLLMLTPFCVAGNKNMVQIKGSDTMVNLVQAWAEKFMAENPKYFVAVTGGGSGTGISSLISGSCDIAMSSRPVKPKEMVLAEKRGERPTEIKVALDGLAVVVNPKNPVSKLTLDQIADIFSGKITNWKQVGGKAGNIVILSREVNSGTHVYFKEHVLRKGNPKAKVEFSSKALMLCSSQAIADEITQNQSAIGYYGMGYISKKQKAIAIAKDAKSVYEKPLIVNVISNKYPISRPLFLYTSQKPAGIVKAFINFALSKEGQKIVLMTDFVPIKK